MLPPVETLKFRAVTLKNPLLRASGVGLREWELEFARAGIGAIISARVRPPLALGNEAVASWQEHVGRIHAYRCAYLIRIGDAGSPGVALGTAEIQDVVQRFADAARSARETGADGIEIDGSEGSLIARFLGPSTWGRTKAYYGSVENRGRLAREIVEAVRDAVGPGLHLQVRLGVTSPLGMLAAGIHHLAQWLEAGGADAIHFAAEGDFPGARSDQSIAIATRFIRDAVGIPVLRNGAFVNAEEIVAALQDGSCDGLTLTRPLRRPAAAAAGPLLRVV